VKVHGEIWNAECPAGEIEYGAKVVVTGLKGLNLIVNSSE
jgi:membrane-bound ClpP family serine protease